MRENLIGYLLGALDESEAREVEAALSGTARLGDAADGSRLGFVSSAPDLSRELTLLRRAFEPLESDAAPVPVPEGLASRSIELIRNTGRSDDCRRDAAALPFRKPAISPAPDAPTAPRRRQMLDRVLIAASALAASILLAPLLLDSIDQARARRAERNLGVVSQALHGYASHHRVFPSPPDSGPLSRGGLYAPILVSEERLVADDGTLILPGTPLAHSGRFRVPTVEELEAAVGTDEFERMVRTMGGDFGYTLGHRCPDGHLQRNSDRRRADHPLMADAPDDRGRASENHAGGLHHVLFEDGHVKRLFIDEIGGQDHIYHNHHGVVAAGVCEDDAVIGASHHVP